MSHDLQVYFTGETERWKKRFVDPQYPIEAQKEMEETIDEFKKFADAYLEYFKQKGKRPPLPLPLFDEWSKNTLLEYWIPLSMVAAQYQVTEYRRRLNRITRDVLKPLIDNAKTKCNIEISGVLLYINKRPISYFYPYTNRSFVALSWIDDEVLDQSNQDLINSDKVMALPHELAHHIYWNSNFGRTPVVGRDILSSRLDLSDIVGKLSIDFPNISQEQKNAVAVAIQRWAEEIFADVVGTLISGDREKFAISAQNLVKRYCVDKEDMVYNDGYHPVAVLRPLIAARALEWSKVIGKDPPNPSLLNPDYTQYTVAVGDIDVKIEYLIKALDLAIDKIYKIIDQKIIQPAGPADRISNFGELMDYAEQEKIIHGTEIYDTLLSPLIFERATVSGTCTNCHKSVTAKCPKCGK